MLPEHLRRMQRAARVLGILCSLNPSDLKRDISRLLTLNRLSEAYIRITLTAGQEGEPPNLIGLCSPLPKLPAHIYHNGVKVIKARWHRSDLPIYRLKTLNYLENMIARDQARKAGAFEAIFADAMGQLLEGSVSNLFMVKGTKVITPHLRSPILPGITRELIIKICLKEGIKVIQQDVHQDEFLRADEAFITNSLIEVVPVTRFEGHRIGTGIPGGLTLRILKKYRKLVRNLCRRGRT